MNIFALQSTSLRIQVLAWFALSASGFVEAALPNDWDLPAVRVRVADLNLSSPEGVSVLYARIKAAAYTVCGVPFSLWDGTRYRTWKSCYRETVDRAVHDVNSEKLTALHLTQQGLLGSRQASSPTAQPPGRR